MQRKSYLLIFTVILFSFGTSACLPFMFFPSNRTGVKKTGNRRKTSSAPKVLDVDKDAFYVNAMGKEMPDMPEFEQLSPKPGKVRGYVTDLEGNPLKGAQLGIRATAIGGAYSGAQGETNADGYYEFQVPAGVAHFYNAGYAVEWGEDGLAAIGLHPADGKVDSFASNVGGVENFVLLPYGITSRENLSQSAHLPSSYYGGAVYLSYYAAETGDNYPMEGSIPVGSIIEVTLTPDGEMFGGGAAPKFTVRKTVGFRGGFYINNLPLGRYRIQVKTEDGEQLQMSLVKPRGSEFGIKPSETTGSAVLTFAPSDARAGGAVPQYGGWSAVEISIASH